MEKYKKLSDFEIEYIRNKFNSKQEKIEKLKRKLHLTNRQVNWLIDTKEREDLVDKLIQIENHSIKNIAASKYPMRRFDLVLSFCNLIGNVFLATRLNGNTRINK